MDKYFKVVYRDFEKLGNEQHGTIAWKDGIKEAIVSWGEEPYDDKVSYRYNLSAMVIGIFDSGFVEVSAGKIIPTSCVLQILEHQGAEDRKSEVQPRSEDRGEQRNGNGNDRRHGKYRKMRPQQRNDQRQDRPQQNNQAPKPETQPVVEATVPPKPTPPPNELRRDTEIVGEGMTVGLSNSGD